MSYIGCSTVHEDKVWRGASSIGRPLEGSVSGTTLPTWLAINSILLTSHRICNPIEMPLENDFHEFLNPLDPELFPVS